MRIHSMRTWRAIAAFLILPPLAVSLAAAQSSSLSVAGQPGSAKVIKIGGRNYVELEGLAQITNSSVSFHGSHIVLTLSGATAEAPATEAPPPSLSKEFVAASIEAMAETREWHAALKNAIDRGFSLTEDWLTAYREQAQQALQLASVAANTTADKDAIPFVTSEFNNMRELSDKYLKIANSMTYIPPNSLDNDPLDKKIRTCAHSLASMATVNQFVDDGSCQ